MAFFQTLTVCGGSHRVNYPFKAGAFVHKTGGGELKGLEEIGKFHPKRTWGWGDILKEYYVGKIK